MAKNRYDLIIIGAGPAGLFAADALAGKLETLVIDRRANAGGAGARTDGKLNLTHKIGMDIEELKIAEDYAEQKIRYIDEIFLKYGADPTLSGTNKKEVERLVKLAKEYDVELVTAKQRHMGSDLLPHIINNFKTDLEKRGIRFSFKTEAEEILHDNSFYVRCGKSVFESKYLFVAPGRGNGARWLMRHAEKLGVKFYYGPIDIGFRLEMPANAYKPITDIIYDPKFRFKTRCHGDLVRTFCTNPYGRIRREKEDPRLINGDALKKNKTKNTNFAILHTFSLSKPNADTQKWGERLIKDVIESGGGFPIAQRLGDLLNGSRSWPHTFFDKSRGYDKLKPTLKIIKNFDNRYISRIKKEEQETGKYVHVTPADLSSGYRSRTFDNCKELLIVMNKFIPGISDPANIAYGPEVKLSYKYKTKKDLETNVKRFYVGGDGAAKSRSIVGAGLTGILAAEGILEKA